MALIKNFFTEQLPGYLKQTGEDFPTNGSEFSDLFTSLEGGEKALRLVPLFLVVLFPVIGWLFSFKLREAFNLDKNSSGILQWSSFFYRHDGIIPALPFLCGYVPGATAALACYFAVHNHTYGTFLTFFAGYVLVPIADLILGEDSYNATEEEEDKMKRNPWFRYVTLLYTPTYIATIVYGVYAIIIAESLTNTQLFGITLSVGIAGGFGIGCVHELIHRPHFIDMFSGVVATVFANYSHFWIEHLWGHHKRVATDEDPASSALGDDLYTFLVKDIYYSFTDALKIESKFLSKKKKSFIHNRILQGYAFSALIAFTVYQVAKTYGGDAKAMQALIFYIGQGIWVALHIENANYIEHYGLRRRKVEGQKDREGEQVYERPGWFHAWDTADRLTNWILFKIQRHPDHHTNAGRAYQILRTIPQSPKMPTGYAGMFVLSWCPPLYWAIMDPLVRNAYAQRAKMEHAGVAASAFPKGSNNMSSWWKREGEGYFEEGSSPYNNWIGSDKAQERDVYDTDYNSTFSEATKKSKIIESTVEGQSAKLHDE